MASYAIGGSVDVICGLADAAASTGAVARQAISRSGKSRVIGHGIGPAGGGVMAALAIASDCGVNRSIGS